MEKIKMTTPLVEMDGDEMTRILWADIKELLLTPYIDLNTEYYDLGLRHRDDTDDKVTLDAAYATKNTALRSSALRSPPTPSAWKNITLKKCGKAPTARFVRFWTAPFSEVRLSLTASARLSRPGQAPSLLRVTRMATYIATSKLTWSRATKPKSS